jgi:hypothetical protein
VNQSTCCQIKASTNTRAGAPVRRLASRVRPGGELAGWLLPSVTLALLPKCPACVAAYIALATGIGISMPTATYLRATLIVLCIASLAFVAVRRLRSFMIRRVRPHS